jgi:predicted SnoaL-like aldol condensation-catalyzing enzyme
MAGHKLAVAAAMMFLGGCATLLVGTAQAAQVCDDSPASNRRVVLAFYTEGLIGHQPRHAFERYMAPGFVEHKPDVPLGTRESAATFLEELLAEMPQPRWDVLRTISEGDLVFLHARFTPAEGAPAYAIADIFRLKECKIVEHWDVVAPPPKDQRNSNPRF